MREPVNFSVDDHTRDHLSVISGITDQGRRFQMLQTAAYRSADVVRFLRQLLRQVAGRLLVIWDGAPIHRSHAIKDFLAARAAGRLHLERLPGDAPDLNPDEGIWQYLKHVELRNRCCRSLADLRTELRLAVGRLRHKRELIRACIRHCYPALSIFPQRSVGSPPIRLSRGLRAEKATLPRAVVRVR
jgi:transposase